MIPIFFINKSAVPLQRLIRSHTKQADRPAIPMLLLVESAKMLCKISLMHPVAIVGKRLRQINDIGILWYLTHPYILLCIIPRIPIHFVTTQRCPCYHRKSDPVKLYAVFVFQALKSAGNIVRSHGILRLKILRQRACRFSLPGTLLLSEY